jgi:hypothetical protein
LTPLLALSTNTRSSAPRAEEAATRAAARAAAALRAARDMPSVISSRIM